MILTKLPEEWIEGEPRRLSDLRKGETSHVMITELTVQPDRSCLMRRNAKLSEPNLLTMAVRRDADGNLHVTIPAQSQARFRIENPLLLSLDKYDPVASITFEDKRT